MSKNIYLIKSDEADQSSHIEVLEEEEIGHLRNYSINSLDPNEKFKMDLCEEEDGEFILSNVCNDTKGSIKLALFELVELKYILDVLFSKDNMIAPYKIYKEQSE